MSQKEPEICSACGAKLVEYKHRLSRVLMRGLRAFVEKFGDRPGELSAVGLDYSTRCNFQKIRYWDLIEKVGDKEGKGGVWKLTKVGIEFLSARTTAFEAVRTFRGERVAYEGKPVKVTDLSGGWTYRPQYAQEAKPHEPDQKNLW